MTTRNLRRFILSLAALAGLSANAAAPVTNYVYLIHEITNRVYVVSNVVVASVREITNNVKNTHFNYYYTNNVAWVTNVYTVNYRTNVSVNVDLSQEALDAAVSARAAAALSETNANVSASSASVSAGSADANRRQAESVLGQVNAAGSTAVANINERIRWFDEHAGETITVVNVTTNVDVHVAETVVSNDFRNVPYDPDPALRVNLNELAVMAPGGTGNVYRVTAPSDTTVGGSVGIGYLTMTFDRFDLVDGTGRYWYRSDYDTGVPPQGSGTTWKFEWAYWFGGAWHVAIRQRSFSGGSADEGRVFEMTLPTRYPLSSGTFSNRPSVMWGSDSFGELYIGYGYSTNLAVVGRLCLYEQARALAEAADARLYADGLFSGLNPVIEDIANRLSLVESGAPSIYAHGGTTYSNIVVYATDQGDGKVRATPFPATAYAAASYTLSPDNSSSSSSATSWTFVPGYVDSDSKGMRLQYVPTTTNVIKFAASSTRIIVPEYLYWQGGNVYCKVRTFVSGSPDGNYADGHIAYPNYPNRLTTSGVFVTDSKKNWGSTAYGVGRLSSTSTSAAGAPIWFSASPSLSVLPYVNWMSTGK